METNMIDNIKTLFKHVETNKLISLQMLDSGELLEAGYSNSLGFYILLENELILFNKVEKFLEFSEKKLTYIGDI